MPMASGDSLPLGWLGTVYCHVSLLDSEKSKLRKKKIKQAWTLELMCAGKRGETTERFSQLVQDLISTLWAPM